MWASPQAPTAQERGAPTKPGKQAAPATPLRLQDLPDGGAALRGQPPERVIAALHDAAVAAGCDMYLDASGYSVFTSAALARRPCCGNRCRHCPYDHANVPENKAARRGGRQAARQQQKPEEAGSYQDRMLSW
jgi:hypothetical protein